MLCSIYCGPSENCKWHFYFKAKLTGQTGDNETKLK